MTAKRRKPTARNSSQRTSQRGANAKRKRDELPTIPLSRIEAEVVQWLWRDRIPLGKLTLLVGHPGQTKSLATVDIAARITTGTPFPDAPNVEVPQGRVIMLNAEDDAGDMIRPRIEAACGDPEMVEVLDLGGAAASRPLRLDKQLARLRRLVQQRGDVRLVVVDPLMAFLGGTDTHRDAAVRQVLGPLSALAAKSRVAILAVMHLTKSGGSTGRRVGGSIGFVGVANAVLAIGVDPNDPTRRILAPQKAKTTRDRLSLGYRIDTVETPDAGAQPRIIWDESPTAVTADEAIRASEAASAAGELAFALAWLRQKLADGPVLSRQLKADAQRAGIAPTTLQRAAKTSNVVARKIGAQWYRALDRARVGR